MTLPRMTQHDRDLSTSCGVNQHLEAVTALPQMQRRCRVVNQLSNFFPFRLFSLLFFFFLLRSVRLEVAKWTRKHKSA